MKFAVEDDRKDLGPILSVPWISLFCALFLLLVTTPYFMSSAVLFTHNPVDEAIVNFLGPENVKPLLLLFLFCGGLLGLTTLFPLRNLFGSVMRTGYVALTRKKLYFYVFYPFLGPLVSSVVYNLVTRLPPGASLVWGAISYLFFMFPALGFMLSSSITHLLLYYKVKSKAKENSQILKVLNYPKREKSISLELANTL
ncbi:MAG: hypothetical protein R6V83_13570 [Candidatus Thorarchaeota archaeon]